MLRERGGHGRRGSNSHTLNRRVRPVSDDRRLVAEAQARGRFADHEAPATSWRALNRRRNKQGQVGV